MESVKKQIYGERKKSRKGPSSCLSNVVAQQVRKRRKRGKNQNNQKQKKLFLTWRKGMGKRGAKTSLHDFGFFPV